MGDFSSLNRNDLLQLIARLDSRLKVVEAQLRGQPITAAMIRSLTWTKGRGGTLVLGGLDNGAGVLSILDASDIEKIRADKDGILVKDGAIELQDEDGDIVLDVKGIKSLTQFLNSNATQSSDQSTTSTSFGDVSGTSLTFTLDRNVNVLVIIDASGYNIANLSGNDNCMATLSVDGSDQSKQMTLPGSKSGGGSLFGNTASLAYLLNLGSGSHTIKMRFRSVNGGAAHVVFSSVTYVVLGK